jgi:hypothetical protein
MEKTEIERIIDSKIKSHEVRVGYVSGVIGLLFTFGIFHSVWILKKMIEIHP